MKALAVLLYRMGSMSFSIIGRVLRVSDVAVLKWVRAEAASLPEPEVGAAVVTLEVDEMWHFLKKSLPISGCGGPMTWISGEPWPGCWVGGGTSRFRRRSRWNSAAGVMMRPAASSSTRSA